VPDPSASQSPIFIIGTERSGSNLLRLILNSHSGIAVPHPPHILRYFEPLLPSYGDLSSDARFRRLAADVNTLIRLHICPWEFRPDHERAAKEARPRSLFGLYLAFYEQYREWSGKRRWGCKSTFMLDHVEMVLEELPGAKFILVVRDPRDVAASSKRSVFNPCHPHFTSLLWREQQARGASLLDRLPGSTIFLVRYEDLLLQPEEKVKEVCDFVGEAFEPGMLRYFETAEARKCSRLSLSWENTARPILKDNHGKYRTELGRGEVLLVEALTHQGMERFGYRLENSPSALRGVDPHRRRLYDRLAEVALRLRVELRSLLRDRNHWRRWARAIFLAGLKCRLFLEKAALKCKRLVRTW
jgi:hypothetical protein